MNWMKIEEKKPEYHKQVLLKYLKGKREVITQGYFCDYAQDCAERQLTVEFWRDRGYGEVYFDYSERQIQALNAKTSKNKVISWMEIPK